MLRRRVVFVFEGGVCELALGALAVDVALTAVNVALTAFIWPSFDSTTCITKIIKLVLVCTEFREVLVEGGVFICEQRAGGRRRERALSSIR